jgi:DNA helicase-2/ATP-dependent DNA helicase PcrA
MSDADVAALLRSDEPLVVIEARGGCGKTHQGADYAKDVAAKLTQGRLLVLAHTHAACGEFRKRTRAHLSRVEVKTLASLVTEVVSVYYLALGVPPNAEKWAWKNNGKGFDEVAQKCAELVSRHPMVGRALARRYPVVICDEHQDCTPDQNTILLALLRGGSKLRIFADPMQRLFSGKTAKDAKADAKRWEELKVQGKFAELDFPHRWSKGSRELGAWVLEARGALRAGKQVVVPAKRPGRPEGACR